MSSFVNKFDFGADSFYRAIVSADAAGFRVVGMFGNGGLLAAINADGASEWQKLYTIAGKVIRFWSGVRCDNGDLMLHGSLLKNFFTRSLKRRVELGLDLEGPEGMLDDDAEGNGFWQYQCLNQFASRIGGGTEEVHRNNLGEQALGLPREPSADRDVPWNQTVRS